MVEHITVELYLKLNEVQKSVIRGLWGNVKNLLVVRIWNCSLKEISLKPQSMFTWAEQCSHLPTWSASINHTFMKLESPCCFLQFPEVVAHMMCSLSATLGHCGFLYWLKRVQASVPTDTFRSDMYLDPASLSNSPDFRAGVGFGVRWSEFDIFSTSYPCHLCPQALPVTVSWLYHHSFDRATVTKYHK